MAETYLAPSLRDDGYTGVTSRKGQSRFLSAVSARLTFETPSLRQIFLRD